MTLAPVTFELLGISIPLVRRFAAFALGLGVIGTASAAEADPLPPKICVAVEGDADASVQAFAAQLNAWSAARRDLRTVADVGAVRALRGDASGGTSVQELLDARRSLAGTDADAAVMDRIGARLGCTVVLEVSARPSGLHLRAYDSVTRRFPRELEVGAWTPTVLDAALGERVASSAAPATLAVGPFGIAADAHLVLVPPPPPSAPASHPTASSNHGIASILGGYGGWIIAGGAVLALLGGFLYVQSQGPGTPVINVHHGAGEQP